MLNSFYYRKTY